MMQLYFQKTDKGREEIATRRHGLSLRLRSILLLIDGKKSVEDLLRTYPGLGLTEALLADLEGQGFVTPLVPAQHEKKASHQHSSSLPQQRDVSLHTHLSMSVADDEPPARPVDPIAAFLNTIFPDELTPAESHLRGDGMMTSTDDPVKRPTFARPVEEHPTLFEAIKACYFTGMRSLPPASAAPLLRTLNNARTVKALADMSTAYIEALRAAQGKAAVAKLEEELDLLLFACEA